MKPLVNEILQRIIHKAMLGNAAESVKLRGGNAHPEVRAKTLGIGTRVSRVLAAFIYDMQLAGRKALVQSICQLLCCGGHQDSDFM